MGENLVTLFFVISENKNLGLLQTVKNYGVMLSVFF